MSFLQVPAKRFQAIYPTLKELALAGSPGTKAIKQVSLELLAITAGAMMCESNLKKHYMHCRLFFSPDLNIQLYINA